MPIIKMVDPYKHPHSCQTPENPEKEYGEGTVWECDICGWQFCLVELSTGWRWIGSSHPKSRD